MNLIPLYRKELGEMHLLEKGWDSYDADPPNENAIANTLRIIHTLEQNNISIRRINPSVIGGIGIHVGKNYIECLNNGQIGILLQSGKATNITTTYQQIAEMVK